jgi:hypothetical protein
MPGFTKVRENWEERYVSDYVLTFYPNDLAKFRCPLGSVPGQWIQEMGLGKAIKAYRPYRPEVDALVVTADELVAIEGKIFKVMDGIAKLPIYRSLIYDTPELSEYRSLPVQAVLVTPKDPGWSRKIADESKVKVHVWAPAWIQEYYEKQESYWTQDERFKRIRRKQVLEDLGFEK